ncbi:MAG TPA: molybdate ABC transporter substrate-binding protein [Phototrophicaceae bacterium]|nr:molybdate ABC transporter substrate-binding protein [Phototrophicaceae bacterium]
MKRAKVIGFLLLAWLVLALPLQAQEKPTLTIFAAASLTDAFTEIGEVFQAAYPEVELVYNFGSSSALATQLVEGGAPADIFASANEKQMKVAVDGERIGSEPVIFARNRLVLIVPAENPAEIKSLADLATAGIDLVLAAPGVPVRDYTDAMLEKLAADPAYGAAYKDAFLANLVSEEDNVRQVTAKVALGEAEAGIVYSSDVTPDVAEQVIALPIPDAVNTLATYPIAITNDSANPELAQAWVDLVTAETGQKILVKWGFIERCPVAVEVTAEATLEATLEATAEVELTPEATPDAAGC